MLILGKEHLRRARNSSSLSQAWNSLGHVFGGPRLDLDKSDLIATSRDDVDFADRDAPIARDDVPARQAQSPPTHPFSQVARTQRGAAVVAASPCRRRNRSVHLLHGSSRFRAKARR